MKKIVAVLILSGVCAALLFAQDLGGRPQPSEAPQVASETQTEAVAPVVLVVPVVKPAPVEVIAEPVETVVEITPVVEEIAETDEIGITDDMTAGAELVGGRISLTLKGVELREVVGLFSRLSNANIIVPDLGEEIQAKRIDMNLDNVEWKPALQAILDTNGLELYEKIPGTDVYSIRPREAGRPESLEMKTFRLSYAAVNSVTGMVQQLLGTTGSYSVFPERNIVAVLGTAQSLQSIEQVMAKIDLPREQVFIEAKFLELSDKAQRDLGINWQVLEAYNIKASGLNLNYSSSDGSTETQTKLYDVEGRPYEEALGDDLVDFAARPGNPAGDHRIFNMTPTLSDVQDVTSLKTLTAVLGAEDFELILSALEQKDGVDLVSNPKIIVANEQEATIHLGQKEPNIRIERTSGTTDNPGGSVSVGLDADLPYFEDGVKVLVKPTINTSSNIMIRITPELTSFIGRKSVEASGTSVEYPISLTKKIDTVFSLRSGQTAAIGGLTQVEESRKENQIPWLGSIPLIGRFFSYEQTVLDRNETIIFVTVGLANPSSIDMETGLPENTRLAQRYRIREAADARIEAQQLEILRTKENGAMEKELNQLREANRQLIEKQNAKNPAPDVSSTAPVAPEEELPAPVVEEISITLAAEPVATAEEFGGGTYEVKSPGTK